MHYDEHAITIWVDGSSFQNPGKKNGLAGYIQYPDEWDLPGEKIFQEGYDPSNIARMELRAVIRAFEYIRKHREAWQSRGVHRIQIATDSQYVAKNSINVSRWIKDKGRGVNGQPIANMDLWKNLNSLRRIVPAEIHWHPGKTNPHNKAVDALAKAAAKGLGKKKDSGFRQGKVARSPVGGGPVVSYPARGDTAIIKVFHYVTIDSRTKELKIKFSVQDPITGVLTGKFYAYARNMEPTRKGLMRAVFGKDSNYPTIEILEPLVDVGAS